MTPVTEEDCTTLDRLIERTIALPPGTSRSDRGGESGQDRRGHRGDLARLPLLRSLSACDGKYPLDYSVQPLEDPTGRKTHDKSKGRRG